MSGPASCRGTSTAPADVALGASAAPGEGEPTAPGVGEAAPDGPDGPDSPNRAPVADAQAVNAERDTATPILLTGTDPDNDGVVVTEVGSPSNGTISGTVPNVVYTPRAGYVGPDSFTFVVSDGADSEVIPGFAEAVIGQPVGSQVGVVVAPEDGYGEAGSGSIPAGATLFFVIDILGVV